MLPRISDGASMADLLHRFCEFLPSDVEVPHSKADLSLPFPERCEHDECARVQVVKLWIYPRHRDRNTANGKRVPPLHSRVQYQWKWGRFAGPPRGTTPFAPNRRTIPDRFEQDVRHPSRPQGADSEPPATDDPHFEVQRRLHNRKYLASSYPISGTS